METQPEEMTLAKLQVLIMPNGEVLCLGERIGFFKDLKKYLESQEKKPE